MVDPERHSHHAGPQRGWLASKLHNFHLTHERVKHTVHTAWRLPLPPWGQVAMGFVYFTIPVIAGYHITTWAVSQSESTIEERLGKADAAKNIQGMGDKKMVLDKDGEERVEKVGAGGWGGGVHLVAGDTKTQDVNRINLERFMKKQRKEKMKRERGARRKDQEEKEASAA